MVSVNLKRRSHEVPSRIRPTSLRLVTLLAVAMGVAGALDACDHPHPSRKPGLRQNDKAALIAGECPYKTPAQWQEFLNLVSDNEKWADTCEDSTCDEEYYNFVKDNVQKAFDNCRDELQKNPAIDRCTTNLRKFVPAWLRQHDAVSYGFAVDNETYLAQEDAADKPPGMMKPPDAVVAAIPDRNKVEEAARVNGWRYLTHDSMLHGVRTFIYIPDPQGRFDQWMLLNLGDSSSAISTSTPMSFIAVQKKDSAGNDLARIRIFFRDYTITNNNGTFGITLQQSNNGKCYSCHPSGMRTLIARHTPTLEAKPVKGEADYNDAGTNVPDDFAYKRLMEFNQKLGSYGLPDWQGNIDPSAFGPALGAESGCTDCHNGKDRGVINVATSTDQLEQKLYYQLSMPPAPDAEKLLERSEMKNPALSGDEDAKLKEIQQDHDDLTSGIEDARFPALKSWLLANPCQ